MISVIVMGLIFLVVLIVGHEFGHFIAAKIFKLRVDEFGIGFPPKIFSRKIGETKYSINSLPFGGFVKIHGEHSSTKDRLDEPERSFIHQSVPKRMTIIIAGVLMNFLIGWIAFSVVFSIGTPKHILIENIAPDSPAAIAGLKIGDYIEGYESADNFLSFVNNNLGKEISLNEYKVAPRINPPEKEGPLGITIVETGVDKQPILKSFLYGFKSMAEITVLIIKAFIGLIGGIFTGDFTLAKQVSGPVGVLNILGETSRLGFASLIQFLGLISINLAVINLFPFPALDGGRFVFVLLEGITRRRLNEKFEIIANAAGLIILLLLMVIVTIRDIIKIF
jgi:regulator of sigma E protease